MSGTSKRRWVYIKQNWGEFFLCVLLFLAFISLSGKGWSGNLIPSSSEGISDVDWGLILEILAIIVFSGLIIWGVVDHYWRKKGWPIAILGWFDKKLGKWTQKTLWALASLPILIPTITCITKSQSPRIWSGIEASTGTYWYTVLITIVAIIMFEKSKPLMLITMLLAFIFPGNLAKHWLWIANHDIPMSANVSGYISEDMPQANLKVTTTLKSPTTSMVPSYDFRIDLRDVTVPGLTRQVMIYPGKWTLIQRPPQAKTYQILRTNDIVLRKPGTNDQATLFYKQSEALPDWTGLPDIEISAVSYQALVSFEFR